MEDVNCHSSCHHMNGKKDIPAALVVEAADAARWLLMAESHLLVASIASTLKSL